MSYHWDVGRQARPQGFGAGAARTRSIRMRRMEIAGQLRAVTIRLVEAEAVREEACSLINRRYVRKGYGGGHRIPASPHHMTFTAEVDGAVAGTITLAVDSERGLAADRTFGDALDARRAQPGAFLCELTKFAFDDAVHSKELMAALFHIVFVYGYRTHGCSDLLIEVHPRHVRFYEAMLGFERVGELRVNESVGAALQLMALRVADIRANIDRCAGAPAAAGSRSLYPLFFSPEDEAGIYARLADAAIEQEAMLATLAELDPRHVLPSRPVRVGRRRRRGRRGVESGPLQPGEMP